MVWVMQVRITIGDISRWEDVTWTNGTRYEYNTEEEAQKMSRICYPEADPSRIRVKEMI